MIIEFEIQKNAAGAFRFFMMGLDGFGKTALNALNFTETVRNPTNGTKALTTEVYLEQEGGWYSLFIPANYFDINGVWSIQNIVNSDGGSFDGTVIIKVTEHDPHSDIAFLKDVAGGKWLIESNQLKFYKADNTTPVATFDLKNAAGVASMQDVFVRERV